MGIHKFLSFESCTKSYLDVCTYLFSSIMCFYDTLHCSVVLRIHRITSIVSAELRQSLIIPLS